MKLYGPYKCADGRARVTIQAEDRSTRTITYARWLMEQVHEREFIGTIEQVDHINGDRTDDRLENLRVVPIAQHQREDALRVRLHKVVCPWCDEVFEREPRYLRRAARKGMMGPFCGKRCAGSYSREVQLGRLAPAARQPMVDSTYYKLKTR